MESISANLAVPSYHTNATVNRHLHIIFSLKLTATMPLPTVTTTISCLHHFHRCLLVCLLAI